MPNDARLGLVVGVTLVILCAVLFARKEGASPPTVGGQPPPNLSKAGLSAPVPGVPGVAPKTIATAPVRPRTHTVEEGETLMSLSKQYFGDTGHVGHLFHANQDRILAPDRVPVGTVIRIPDTPSGPAPGLER
ncbi:MAG: LysM peptidoglycan-binding domain-containing protein [Gemmataceae bacterium]